MTHREWYVPFVVGFGLAFIVGMLALVVFLGVVGHDYLFMSTDSVMYFGPQHGGSGSW